MKDAIPFTPTEIAAAEVIVGDSILFSFTNPKGKGDAGIKEALDILKGEGGNALAEAMAIQYLPIQNSSGAIAVNERIIAKLGDSPHLNCNTQQLKTAMIKELEAYLRLSDRQRIAKLDALKLAASQSSQS